MESLRRLTYSGVLVQVTAGALSGAFGSVVRRFSLQLLAEGLVHVIASDAHDAIRRPPGLREAIVGAGYGSHAAWLTEDVPAALLAGERLPQAPSLPEAPRRRWWQRG